MSTTLGEALNEAVQCLEQAGIAEPRAAAEVLLADLLSLTRPQLYLEAHRPLRVIQQQFYTERITRRRCGEPVQYITGRQEFWSLDFKVNAHVLIPRPESELLVEHGVRLMRQWCVRQPQLPLYLLDVGTGSGNLAISLGREFPQSQVWGVDAAVEALQVARRNAQRLGVADRLSWVCGDVLAPFRDQSRFFALCVGNLPYVTTDEWQQLPREIRGYEPRGALLGGRDGLDLIRRLIDASPGILAPEGSLLLEVGCGQASTVADIVRQTGLFQRTAVFPDYAGIDRVVWAQGP
jgi:release factor glutamine methyltransferase